MTNVPLKPGMEVTEEVYAAHIPKCCEYQGMRAHTEMMLCWGLLAALEQGERMDCRGCDLATRGHWLEINPHAAVRRAGQP